jgi:hypothetical protein
VRVIRVTRECPGVQSTWRFHHLTDLHVGAKGHAREALERRVQEIADDPFAIWGGGGDYGDLINASDKRFQAGMHPDDYHNVLGRIVDYSLEECGKLLSPIKDKCIFLGDGNHERTIGIRYHRGFTAELARSLDLDRFVLGYRGWISLGFCMGKRRQAITIFQYHGWSAGRLKGRKALQANRDIGDIGADIICLGHDHQPYHDIFYTRELRTVSGAYLPYNRPRVIVNGGSWVGETEVERERSADDPLSSSHDAQWAVTKNFAPQGIGGPIVDIHVDMGMSVGGTGGTATRPCSISYEVRQRS